MSRSTAPRPTPRFTLAELASIAQRLRDGADIRGEDECWPWTRAKAPAGYGRLTIRFGEGRTRQGWYAHRLAFIIHRKPIPDGMLVLHSCDRPECVNPAHLRAGTPHDNVQDREKRGRGRYANKTHCIHGHDRTPENTYMHSGRKVCRPCRLASNRRYYQRNGRKRKGKPDTPPPKANHDPRPR